MSSSSFSVGTERKSRSRRLRRMRLQSSKAYAASDGSISIAYLCKINVPFQFRDVIESHYLFNEILILIDAISIKPPEMHGLKN